jgi:hypothetical protein
MVQTQALVDVIVGKTIIDAAFPEPSQILIGLSDGSVLRVRLVLETGAMEVGIFTAEQMKGIHEEIDQARGGYH